jgi:hypothetical protein
MDCSPHMFESCSLCLPLFLVLSMYSISKFHWFNDFYRLIIAINKTSTKKKKTIDCWIPAWLACSFSCFGLCLVFNFIFLKKKPERVNKRSHVKHWRVLQEMINSNKLVDWTDTRKWFPRSCWSSIKERASWLSGGRLVFLFIFFQLARSDFDNS